jgi:hypothetical protein
MSFTNTALNLPQSVHQTEVKNKQEDTIYWQKKKILNKCPVVGKLKKQKKKDLERPQTIGWYQCEYQIMQNMSMGILLISALLIKKREK